MKEKIAITLCLLILSLAMLTLAIPAKAVDGHPPFGWVEPTYSGYDPYYHDYIIGYLTGTNWNFTLSWTNWYGTPINVSSIRMYFSWGKNYTSAFATPTRIDPDQTQIFNLYGVTPPITEAPEHIAPYWYAAYIHHVNSTTTPYEEVGVIDPGYGGSDFVALSADHLACLNYWSKYGMFFEGTEYATMLALPQMYPMIPFYANITEVQVLLTQAFFEFNLGFQIYMAGVFGTAKTHLESGNTLIDEALVTWSEKGTAAEDANLAFQEAQTNYYNALGESNKTNAYGLILFGLGWVFIGIGVIIYGLRKPKVAQA